MTGRGPALTYSASTSAERSSNIGTCFSAYLKRPQTKTACSATAPAGSFDDGRPLGPDSKGSVLRFDADPIIDGAANALLATQVSLGRLDGDVPEKKLNLLQFATRRVAEPGAGATKVVRRKPLDPCFAGVLTDLRAKLLSPSVHRPRRSRSCLPSETACRQLCLRLEATHRAVT